MISHRLLSKACHPDVDATARMPVQRRTGRPSLSIKVGADSAPLRHESTRCDDSTQNRGSAIPPASPFDTHRRPELRAAEARLRDPAGNPVCLFTRRQPRFPPAITQINNGEKAMKNATNGKLEARQHNCERPQRSAALRRSIWLAYPVGGHHIAATHPHRTMTLIIALYKQIAVRCGPEVQQGERSE